ncbi:hypothetical protein Bca52824_016303 [Brassica carinata]|uniref:Uncharacterized protein n=1 Tax=Brassica carinata TaxID=52824 RepID=A0A8X7W646_BRACI|nr:hypothetical protein Bca52824_016303 [Brassica carinata]
MEQENVNKPANCMEKSLKSIEVEATRASGESDSEIPMVETLAGLEEGKRKPEKPVSLVRSGNRLAHSPSTRPLQSPAKKKKAS